MDNFKPIPIPATDPESIEREKELAGQIRERFFLSYDRKVSLPLYKYLRLHKELLTDPNARFLYDRLHEKVRLRGLELLRRDDLPPEVSAKIIDDFHDNEIKQCENEVEQCANCIKWLLLLMEDYRQHLANL